MTTSKHGLAFITGASTGIGALYAERFAQRGYDLVLVARNQARLGELAERLRKETGRQVETVAADLGVGAEVRRIEALLRSDSRVTVLINNAGAGGVAPLLDSDVDKMEAMIDLNVVALTRLTYAAAPGFVARGGGTIINIASVVALAPDLLNGVYGATKAFVLAFSQSLHHELAAKGVRVQAVLPGATRTDFWAISGRPVEHLPESIVMSVTDMVDAALVGLDQGELVTIPALPDAADWKALDDARKALYPNLSRREPAARLVKAASLGARPHPEGLRGDAAQLGPGGAAAGFHAEALADGPDVAGELGGVLAGGEIAGGAALLEALVEGLFDGAAAVAERLAHAIRFGSAGQRPLDEQAAAGPGGVRRGVGVEGEELLDDAAAGRRREGPRHARSGAFRVAVEHPRKEGFLAPEGRIKARAIDPHRLRQLAQRGPLVALAPELEERRIDGRVEIEGARARHGAFNLHPRAGIMARLP